MKAFSKALQLDPLYTDAAEQLEAVQVEQLQVQPGMLAALSLHVILVNVFYIWGWGGNCFPLPPIEGSSAKRTLSPLQFQ